MSCAAPRMENQKGNAFGTVQNGKYVGGIVTSHELPCTLSLSLSLCKMAHLTHVLISSVSSWHA